MYVTLFKLAAFAAPAWFLLIFLPTWRGTRWLARSALFPVLLSLLYLIGIAVLISESGIGFMQDFGDAEGVTALLARQDVALVAWIHILAFDQLVGVFIYRDNMHHRYIPIIAQSVILFFTFMLGPLGFLSYFLVRLARTGSLWGKSEVQA
jgi:hypothetical protein